MSRRLFLAAVLAAATSANIGAVGPRGPIGPDVPLSNAEQERLARRVTVEGFTAAAVQAAVTEAATQGIPAVFLPAGEYVFASAVYVYDGATLFGEGSRTLVRTRYKNSTLFHVAGDGVRFTRLKLQGADTTPGTDNNTYGVSASGRKNVRIDHSELLGFSYATNFVAEATAQVDHCYIHHNMRDGLGYGVAVISGAYVLVTDNEFSQNRHSLASNGNLDWSSPERAGMYVHKPGRKTHWEFIRNYAHGDDETTTEQPAVDAHPGMDGTFVVEDNRFEDLRIGIGIRDGSGLIYGNLFSGIHSAKNYGRAMAVLIGYGLHNGIPVENAMPHDIRLAENTFLDVERYKYAKYSFGQAENITVDGGLAPDTQKDRGDPPAIPWLREMDEDGVLHWLDARPMDLGVGSVTGVVTDEEDRPVAGAQVLAGERSRETDADGRFGFPEVSEAARFLVVSKPGFERAVAVLKVASGEETSVGVKLSR